MTQPTRLRRVGRTGLNHFQGAVQEEYLTELSGHRWRQLVPRMSDDAILAASLLAIELLIRQVTWSITPADESDPTALSLAAFVEQCRQDMAQSWDEIISNALTMLPWGFSLLEITYKYRRGEIIKSGDIDPLTSSAHNDGLLGWSNWDIRSQDTIDGWDFDAHDNVTTVYQLTNWQRVPIPWHKFLLFRVAAPKNNPEGRSVLRGAYESWYYGHNIARLEAIAVEREATGVPVARVPAAIIDAGGTVYTSYENLVTNLRMDEQAGAIIPSDRDDAGHYLYELELLTTNSGRTIPFDPIINRYDRKKAIALLTDVLLVGHSASGSYNLAQTKNELMTNALNAYLDAIAGTINTYAIKRLLRLNGYPTTLTPRLTFNRIEQIDLDALGLFVQRVSQAGFDWAADEDINRRLRQQADLP